MKRILFLAILMGLFLSKNLVYAQVYKLGNTGSAAGWHKLGTLVLQQQGKDAEFRIVGGAGYNASTAQLGECTIHFRTSNANSENNGFYGAGTFSCTGRTDIVTAIKVVQLNLYTWDFYASLSSYSGDAAILIFNSTESTWNPGFEQISPPTGFPYSDLSKELYTRNDAYFSGSVGIGTVSPREKLSVNGNIRAKEIKVETANWPDYVFAKDYELLSLAETERYIKEKGHLPGIPSAKEAEANGIDLGEMNAKLLKKIEELTLYLIQKTHNDEKLQQELEEQRNLIRAMEGRLKDLEK